MNLSIQEKKIIMLMRNSNINIARIHEMHITKFEESFIMMLRNQIMHSNEEMISDDRLWSIVLGQSGKNRMTELKL